MRYIHYARFAHDGQEYDGKPYEFHLSQVAAIMAQFGYTDEESQAAAWLHDIVEDTNVKIEDINAHFGYVVGDLVISVTGVGKNRKDKQSFILRSLQLFPEACPLKLADRIANVEYGLRSGNKNMVQMYFKENAAFAEVVRPNVPPAMWDRLLKAFEKAYEDGLIT